MTGQFTVVIDFECDGEYPGDDQAATEFLESDVMAGMLVVPWTAECDDDIERVYTFRGYSVTADSKTVGSTRGENALSELTVVGQFEI